MSEVNYVRVFTKEAGEVAQAVFLNNRLITVDLEDAERGLPAAVIAKNIAAALGCRVARKSIRIPLATFREGEVSKVITEAFLRKE